MTKTIIMKREQKHPKSEEIEVYKKNSDMRTYEQNMVFLKMHYMINMTHT